jgi:hypothetical protein
MADTRETGLSQEDFEAQTQAWISRFTKGERPDPVAFRHQTIQDASGESKVRRALSGNDTRTIQSGRERITLRTNFRA